jgi:5-methylcytosine-specific restriction endonuclease McrA
MYSTPFKIGKSYSRKDIYRIMNVPPERQGGNWDTGYNRYENDWFIFANINTKGRTGHDYENRFIGDELEWYGKNRSKLSHPSIQSMLNPEGNIYIFVREDSNNPNFTYIGNGRIKQIFDTSPVKIIWQFNDPNENRPETLSEEVIEPERYIEGATKQISVNVYERNPIARKRCIEHYGTSCMVCGFNFYETYGELGKDFIHVHHLIPLYEIGEEYEIDPIKDLRPVCPNCHAMLHKKKPADSIEELKKLIRK